MLSRRPFAIEWDGAQTLLDRDWANNARGILATSIQRFSEIKWYNQSLSKD